MSSDQTTTEVDVIIVGAGISGLTAAYEIIKARPELKLVVLEAQGRVGGRTWSRELRVSHNGRDRFDVGGQWVGKTQTDVLDLLKELNIATYSQYNRGKKIAQDAAGENHRYKSDPDSFIGGLDKLRIYSKLDDYIKDVPIETPYKKGKAKEWDKISFGQWITDKAWTEEAGVELYTLSEVVLDSPADQVSFLFALFYLSSCGGLEAAADDGEKGAQGFKIMGGAQMISEALVNRVGQDAIRLAEPVEKIDQSEASKMVSVTTSGGQFRAAKAVVAIPPAVLGKVQWNPPMPEARVNITQHLKPRSSSGKFVVTYETPFWREQGLSGETSHESSGILTYDASSGYNNPAILGFASFDLNTTLEDRKSMVIRTLASLFGEEANNFLDYADQQWMNEEYIGGCVASLPPGGYMQHYAEEIRKPFLNVHWAGTETGTNWMGYMSGAVQAGRRAAREVLDTLC